MSRALLDLSVRRDIPDAEIAQIVGSDPERVTERRDDLLREMAGSVGLDGEPDDLERVRDALRQINWRARARPGAKDTAAARNSAPAPPVITRPQESRSVWVLIAAAVLSLLALRRRG